MQYFLQHYFNFSKVKESGVAIDSLKMTAIAGSKFTTKEKVKDNARRRR